MTNKPCDPATDAPIVNLITNPGTPYTLAQGVPVLEIVYPAVINSDACILRMGDEVLMIDCSTAEQAPQVVVPVLKAMGITHVDTAFNSHPHSDHLPGFEHLQGTASIGRLLIAYDEDYNEDMIHCLDVFARRGVPVRRMQDGDKLHLGDAELTVIQRTGEAFGFNDLSALLKIRYGRRTLLSTGDVEPPAQQALTDTPPACGLEADVIKYPHHGLDPLLDPFFRSIRPSLGILTARTWPVSCGAAYLRSMGVTVLNTWDAPIRLRTDGHIWVVDYLPMNNAD